MRGSPPAPATVRGGGGGRGPSGPVRAAVLVAAALAAGLPGGAAGQVPDADTASADTGRVGPAQTQGAAPADTLSLEEALETALGHSPDVRSARADASAEHAARWADWGAFLPTASASMSLSRREEVSNTFVSDEGFPRQRESTVSFTRQAADQTLSLTWDLLRGGRRFVEMDAGAAVAAAAEHRLNDAERAVVAEVKAAYFEALKQQRLEEIARRQLESRRRELEQTRRRFRIAAVNRSDLLGAEFQVREAEVTLLEAGDRVRRARRRLQVAMGREEGGDGADRDLVLAGVERAPAPPGLSAPEMVRRARGSNPELRALTADVEAASAQVWAERTRYLPTITLGYDYSRGQNLGPEGDFFTFDPGDRAETFRVSARWELFTGFGRRERTARAGASLRTARADRARRRLEIAKTVRDLVDEVERRAESLDLLRGQLDVAEERLRLLREQYRLGTADFDQLQRAVDDVTRAEQAVVRERYDYYAAGARLERWAGDAAPGRPGKELEREAAAEERDAGDGP